MMFLLSHMCPHQTFLHRTRFLHESAICMEMMSAEISLLPFFVFFFLFYKKKGARKSGKLYAKCTLEMLTATERKKKKKPGKRKEFSWFFFVFLLKEKKTFF